MNTGGFLKSIDEWRANQPKTIFVSVIVFLSCLLFLYLGLLSMLFEFLGPTARWHFGDFLALWSSAKIAMAHPAAEIYDIALLRDRQIAFGMNPNGENPFPYPPFFLLYLWPFGYLSLEAGYLVWIALTFALFIGSIVKTCSRSTIGVTCALVAPACTMNIIAGQTGFLSAALMIGGVRLAGDRPWLSGALIGALAFKPQVGFLVPIALAAAGHWRAFGAACATVGGLCLAAVATLGWAAWPAWIAMLPAYFEDFDRTPKNLNFMPIPLSNLELLGVAPVIARGLQGLVAVVVAYVIFRVFRKSSSKLAAAALLAGTMVASPHVWIYDFPIFVGAIVLFMDERLGGSGFLSLLDVFIVTLALTAPIFVGIFELTRALSAVPVILMFVLILHRERLREDAPRPIARGRRAGK